MVRATHARESPLCPATDLPQLGMHPSFTDGEIVEAAANP